MTTVAFDGKIMAADRRIIHNDSVMLSGSKMFEYKKGRYISGAGDLIDIRILANWLIDGMKGDKPELGDTEFMLMNCKLGKVFLLDKRLTPIELIAPYAVGSGSDFALAGMRMGLDAPSAVRLAAKCDAFTGNGVEYVNFKNKHTIEE